jgi:hypothetical protein
MCEVWRDLVALLLEYSVDQICKTASTSRLLGLLQICYVARCDM